MPSSSSSTPRPQMIQLSCIMLLLAVFTFAISGCAKLKSDNSGGGHTSASSDNSNTASAKTAPPASAVSGTPTTWEAKAASLNGAVGQTFTLGCSPGGTTYSVWGSDVYTADSSVCTAAVHSGLVTFEQGGTVTIEIRPGRSIYGASERNGVTTGSYGPWDSSFVFKTPNTEAVLRDADEQTPVLWDTSATILRGDNGKTGKFKCPPNGKERSVWGTDTYTEDSSICNAAVHAGKFTRESGGSVTIEIRPGESIYRGSIRNGVTSMDYGAYGRSFVVK